MSKNKATEPATSNKLGMALLPLRLFLGFTFVYAGLQKFFSSDYFSATSPNGFLKQTQSASTTSPIGFILNHTLEHHTLFAFAIAAGELLAGLGILLGLWTRLAALGAFALSTSFFLTVSWGTSPYYFGPDIVFMAALTPLMIAGDGGYLSLGRQIELGVRREKGVAPDAVLSNAPLESEIARRTLIKTGAVAGGAGIAGLAVGFFGYKSNGSKASAMASPTPSATPSASASASATASASTPAGTKVATVADVAVGTAFQFTNPADGTPAYLMQPAAGKFIACSAICTHEGCIVNFDKKLDIFHCPCHGAEFDGKTGANTRGPARRDLAKLNVAVSGNDIYIV